MRILVNGDDTYVATGGKDFDSKLPAIVFLHGAGMDHTVWALLARAFAHHGHAVLAPDFPGHGRSAGVPLTSIAALADWTAALFFRREIVSLGQLHQPRENFELAAGERKVPEIS